MIMAADLHRAVAQIGHGESDGCRARVQFQFAIRRSDGAGLEVRLSRVRLEH